MMRKSSITYILLTLLLGMGLDLWANGVRAQQSPRLLLPAVHAPPLGHVMIAAAHIDSAMTGEADEAILLWNSGRVPVDLTGWTIEVNGRRATFPTQGIAPLAAGARLWCAAEARAFQISFGDPPTCEWAADSDPTVFDLSGASLQLRNTGGTVTLRDAHGMLVDVLLYGDEVGPVVGWQGAPVQLYARGALARQGQVWQRKLAPLTGLPIDHDLATDWASDLADVAWGRRVRFPGWGGWDATDGMLPATLTAHATITVAIAPEGLYVPLADSLARATHTLDLSLYTFEHPELAQHIANAAQRGVRVRLLLEGGPPGGISDLQRWCVRLMAQAGVDVRYLATRDDAPRGLQPRYRYTHAKYGIVDGTLVFTGSENFSWDAMPLPATDKEDTPRGGRRGAYLFVDAPQVAAAFVTIFTRDWAPARFADLQPYAPNHLQFGDPPPTFTQPEPPRFAVDHAPFAAPHSSTGDARFTIVTAPENAMHPAAGLNALIQQADEGDEIYMIQLYEHKFWGSSDGNPISDPNPRLEAMIDAARRGATVRVLLDSFFDDPEDSRSNRATVEYLNLIAQTEGLDMEARTGNPTGGGIHMKLVLAKVDGEIWTALGSLNGGEVSHKLNREVLLMVDAPAIYDQLREVFLHDWSLTVR